MTTDPFTEAAMKHLAAVDHDKSRDWFDGFVACTAWARTHLGAQETDGGHGPRTTAAIREWTGVWPAAQEPTDAEVLAALNASMDPHGPPEPHLERYAPRDVDEMRRAIAAALSARAALSAARRDEEKR